MRTVKVSSRTVFEPVSYVQSQVYFDHLLSGLKTRADADDAEVLWDTVEIETEFQDTTTMLNDQTTKYIVATALAVTKTKETK